MSTQPASIDGNDTTIDLIKNHHHFKQYGCVDIVYIVSNVGSRIDYFEAMNANIFSDKTRNTNKQKIQKLLAENRYNKIFVLTGQHFLTTRIRNHRNIYIEEFNAIIQLLIPYRDIVYCFGISQMLMIGQVYYLPYCMCNRNTHRYLTNQPIRWIFTT